MINLFMSKKKCNFAGKFDCKQNEYFRTTKKNCN